MSATNNAAQAGIGLGSAIAVAISWSQHESILWAILQGFFGWFYVIYYAFTRPGGLVG
ncbi:MULTISPECIES: hypothetical protein [Qipengyuania]|uniref:Uncharacterized protein n=1 Tax=Qipengyuania nanhaisediminis TaxID=604088 RepID=A0A1I5PD46_9SPHN|nr:MULTISPECIES: hypothetical protein [Qipengyuania]MCA0904043.1 hypothetical protein [Qipengyuania aquimaris]SFP32009.1 hypothetical protein SAMN04488060_2333 [Qipengyuania nanhaisediminis]